MNKSSREITDNLAGQHQNMDKTIIGLEEAVTTTEDRLLWKKIVCDAAKPRIEDGLSIAQCSTLKNGKIGGGLTLTAN